MRQSELFTKTIREAPKDETSENAIYLIRAGYVDKLTAGVYSYLPLGLKVLNNIKKIIREEMNAIGAQEILMPALTPKEVWQTTGRWDEIDVMFKLEGAGDKEYSLGSTHEEIVTPLVKKFAGSYKDLPVAVYQIQDKFRNELRAKAGLLRGREFSMKDLYSFHKTQNDLNEYYEKVKLAYLKIFATLGLEALVVEASGGVFSKFSHEFQVVTPNGEDIIVVCQACDFAQNREICDLKTGDQCPNCQAKVEEKKAIETGNIFNLKTRFSEAFDYYYIDENNQRQPVLMGCYGIGPSRIMGTIVEVMHDDKGLIWPKSVAPYQIHLLALSDKKYKEAEELYEKLTRAGYAVLFDDRKESIGVKLNDADLLGLYLQLIIGDKSGEGEIEYKNRVSNEKGLIKTTNLIAFLEKECK